MLLYEMLTGLPPFYDENTNAMYGKILSDPLVFPDSDIVPDAARDLLTKLLNRDATKRMGVNGASEIKAHPFFHSIDWRKLLDRKYEPTFKPNVVCVDVEYTSCMMLTHNRPTSETLPTLIASSRRKPPWTLTSKDRFCHRPCSSNSRAGHTTGRWKV